ncbi:MAG TPA: hypothetical protein DCQ90_04565 [Erysipelotrichaceae bacterium]|nr:hypothetical protein [Erysipelotrichaceae bacterium]
MFSGFYIIFHTIRYVVGKTVKKQWGIRGFIHKTGMWITYIKEPFSNKLILEVKNRKKLMIRAKIERNQHGKRAKNDIFWASISIFLDSLTYFSGLCIIIRQLLNIVTIQNWRWLL